MNSKNRDVDNMMTSGPIFRYLWKLTCSKRSDNGEGRANNNHRPHYLINSRKVGLVFKAFIVSFAAVIWVVTQRSSPLLTPLLLVGRSVA